MRCKIFEDTNCIKNSFLQKLPIQFDAKKGIFTSKWKRRLHSCLRVMQDMGTYCIPHEED